MRVLVLGSGGREHALAWKISTCKNCEKIFTAPGNAGSNAVSTNVDINVSDFEKIASFINDEKIDLLVVGPEDPLVNGIRDYMEENGIEVGIIGPGKKGAQLEGSKDFSKEFMQKHNIPTAGFKSFTKDTLNEGIEYLKNTNSPYVLKADGLAAGKGVIICESESEAISNLTEMLNGKFGDAGNTVVIEEFLTGIEVSIFVLTDGDGYVVLPEAKDYKRIFDADKGPNTGGMGAISPVSFATSEFLDKVDSKIIKRTLEGLKSDNIDYQGFLFIGLMNVNGEPFVIEYNVRMGDPETQAVLTRIESDFLSLLSKTANKELKGSEISIGDNFACTVVMASEGYPGSYEKGRQIDGLNLRTDSHVFHAGVKQENDGFVTNGGRVLAVTSNSPQLKDSIELSYKTISKIKWNGAYYRKDIGQDLLNLKEE